MVVGRGGEAERGRSDRSVAVSQKALRISCLTGRPQPKAPDNGCCLLCCGKAPGATRVGAITADGGRWLQHADGWLAEYFLHGSDS